MILDLSTPGGINAEIIAERAGRPAHEHRKSQAAPIGQTATTVCSDQLRECQDRVMTSPRAGQPAAPEDLIDVSALTAAYYDLHPDPAIPEQRVSFGTSGHRGSSLTTTFNEDHIIATSQAICEYRAGQGINGPLFLGGDTHALSEPATTSALEVFAANDVTVLIDSRDGYTPTPAAVARDPRIQRRPFARALPTVSS